MSQGILSAAVSPFQTILGTAVPEQNSTLLTGTFPSRDPYNTAFGSVNGAVASWNFLQSWFQVFPHYPKMFGILPIIIFAHNKYASTTHIFRIRP
jgi:hypothetical protein